MTDINVDELIAEARSLSTYEGSTLERAADALEQLWKQYGAVQAELAEAHAHFAIQEGRIEQFKRERDEALAEVEELRAQLAKVRQWAQSVALHPDPPADDEMAGQINAAGDVLAILSPTERETPAGEWEYRPGHIGADGRARITSPATIAPDYVREYMAEGGEVVRRRVGPWEEVVSDDRA